MPHLHVHSLNKFCFKSEFWSHGMKSFGIKSTISFRSTFDWFLNRRFQYPALLIHSARNPFTLWAKRFITMGTISRCCLFALFSFNFLIRSFKMRIFTEEQEKIELKCDRNFYAFTNNFHRWYFFIISRSMPAAAAMIENKTIPMYIDLRWLNFHFYLASLLPGFT